LVVAAAVLQGKPQELQVVQVVVLLEIMVEPVVEEQEHPAKVIREDQHQELLGLQLQVVAVQEVLAQTAEQIMVDQTDKLAVLEEQE
jgi:hypothetical protein